MITIEDVRSIGEPRRSYNWEIDFFDDTLLILAQECSFPVDNLTPRDVTQGNLQFSVYADRNLGLLTASFIELDTGYVTSWYNQWFNSCILPNGLVYPVGKTARQAIVRDKTLAKKENVTYRVLLVPINEVQYQRTYDGSNAVIIQLTFQILEIKVEPLSGLEPPVPEVKPNKKSDIYTSMGDGGYSMGPVGSDGSGGYAPLSYPPPLQTEWTGGNEMSLPDGTLAPFTTASSVSGTPFPSLSELEPDLDFSQYTIPPASIDDLKDSSKWSYWPGLQTVQGMNVPLPVGTSINIAGVDVSLGFAKYRDSYPTVTSSGGTHNTAGGVTNGSTFYSTTMDSPDIGTKFIGDLGGVADYLHQIDVTKSLAPVVLDVGKYMDLGPLGAVLPNPTNSLKSLANYVVSPVRNKASVNIKAHLQANNINIPFQVSFR